MVTCQSANQLKTPAKVSWAFKIVSQFGSLGYTNMGKTTDLTVDQKTIIDTLHKEGKPQTCIPKEAGCSQSAVSKHVNKVVWKKKMHNQPRVWAILLILLLFMQNHEGLNGYCVVFLPHWSFLIKWKMLYGLSQKRYMQDFCFNCVFWMH